MISQRVLQQKRMESLNTFFQQTTDFYIAGKYPQCRSNIIAMGQQQKKDYFFEVLTQYPEDKAFLEFVMNLI